MQIICIKNNLFKLELFMNDYYNEWFVNMQMLAKLKTGFGIKII